MRVLSLLVTLDYTYANVTLNMHNNGLKIAFFGSSLLSTCRNRFATDYRGIIRQMHARGHQVTFYEPADPDTRQLQDLADPDRAQVVLYPASEDGVYRALAAAQTADLIIKAGSISVCDELLAAAVIELRSNHTQIVFWDVDAPATLDRLVRNPADPLCDNISRYDLIVTSGGGPIVTAYKALGARYCLPIYSGFDPQTHYPVDPDLRFRGALGFLGNYLPDYEAQLAEFFLKPAVALNPQRFLLGGRGWENRRLPDNVTYVGHVDADDLNTFNCSPLAILSLSRVGMDRYGFSPSGHLFEAAGAGACIISTARKAIEQFLEPGREVLVAEDGHDVIDYLNNLTVVRAHEIGQAARRRVLAEHTCAHRAARLEAALLGLQTGHNELPAMNENQPPVAMQPKVAHWSPVDFHGRKEYEKHRT